jgi:hypothetical protein
VHVGRRVCQPRRVSTHTLVPYILFVFTTSMLLHMDVLIGKHNDKTSIVLHPHYGDATVPVIRMLDMIL